MPRWPAALSFVCAAALQVPASAPASANERQWIAQKAPEGAEVMYGTPESDDILFAIRCDAETKEIFVGFAYDPVFARPGEAVDLVLSSEAGEAVLPAIVSYLDVMDITLIESVNAAGSGLRAILTGSGTLSVTVEDVSEEIPLAGTADSFSDLFSACGE